MDTIFFDVILFLIGFFILIKGADIMIDGSVKFARLFKISEWLIGVVIVGIGTSLPELAISLNAALEQTTVGIGAIIGSNIFNMLVILGFSALVSPIIFKKAWISIDLPINIVSVIILISIVIIPTIFSSFYNITRFDSFILLSIFTVWMIFMVRRQDNDVVDSHKEIDDTVAWPISLVLIIIGLVGVIAGGEWVVDGAISVAEIAGVSKGLMGLTIVAIGTSVPEIAVSFRAIIKRRNSIAVGNIIGSNIFDMLGIIGFSALVAPLVIPSFLLVDLTFLLIASVAIYIFVIIRKDRFISRLQGLTLILFYFFYLIWIIIRG